MLLVKAGMMIGRVNFGDTAKGTVWEMSTRYTTPQRISKSPFTQPGVDGLSNGNLGS
ncbi:MAG: hypothetical protein ABJB74_12190 [Gemmatimonas sp.]